MREHARTWADVGRLPLSRRDGAAMALALEWCRRTGHAALCASHARTVLRFGGPVSDAVARAMDGAWEGGGVLMAVALRARLALALRVLLRVDAGIGDREAAPRSEP